MKCKICGASTLVMQTYEVADEVIGKWDGDTFYAEDVKASDWTGDVVQAAVCWQGHEDTEINVSW